MRPTRSAGPVLLAAALAAALGSLLAAGCGAAAALPMPTVPAPTATPLPSATPLPAPQPSATPTPTAEPTPPAALVVIDAGHGGEDWGSYHLNAAGKVDLVEKEVNLAIAGYTRDALVARGVRVYMLREADLALNEEGVDVNEDGVVTVRDEVQLRVDLANEAGGDLLLSIHQNAYLNARGQPDGSVGGTVTYYCEDRPFAGRNLRLATLVQERSVAALQAAGYDVMDRGVREDGELSERGTVQHLVLLGPVTERIVRASTMPGALTESLFTTNDEEVALLNDDAVRRSLGEAYAEAVLAYLEEFGPGGVGDGAEGAP